MPVLLASALALPVAASAPQGRPFVLSPKIVTQCPHIWCHTILTVYSVASPPLGLPHPTVPAGPQRPSAVVDIFGCALNVQDAATCVWSRRKAMLRMSTQLAANTFADVRPCSECEGPVFGSRHKSIFCMD